MAPESPDAPRVPPYVRRIRETLEHTALEPSVTAATRGGERDPTLVCVLRDERPRLDTFLAHHRALGVRDFLVIDNGSRDGSTEWLAQQGDVTLYPVQQPYTEERKQVWINDVIRRHDPHGWYLVMDADELLVYEGAPERPLSALVALMEARGISRVRGMLVDLYPEGPLVPSGLRGLDDRPHDLFDPEGYTEQETRRMVSRTGGPRRRAFTVEGEALEPELSKYPLFRAAPGDLVANAHHHHPFPANFESPCHLGVLHEKFRFDFVPRVERAVKEGQYWRQSLEYRAYADALRSTPDLSLAYEGSRRYRTPGDLLDAGLIETLNWDD